VLDPFHRPRSRLSEIPALDGVPMRVEAMERYAPLQHCILCTQTKGGTYTICTACYTTQMRFIERMLLEIRPHIDGRRSGSIRRWTTPIMCAPSGVRSGRSRSAAAAWRSAWR
jgi:hypothetical protein